MPAPSIGGSTATPLSQWLLELPFRRPTLTSITSTIRPFEVSLPEDRDAPLETSSTVKPLRETFMKFEDVWYMIMEHLTYYDLLAAQEALPIVNQLLAEYNVRRQQLFLEPAGPAVTFINLHPDLILNDSVGRRFGCALFASVEIAREIEAQIVIENSVAQQESALAVFDPENGEYETWEIVLPNSLQVLMRTAQLYSFQARINVGLVKEELENLRTEDLTMHPEIFTVCEAPSGEYREIKLNNSFAQLNGSKEDLHAMTPFWQDSLLSQPPPTNVAVNYSITRTSFVIRRLPLPFSFRTVTSGTTHVHNPEGISVNNLRIMLLNALKIERGRSLGSQSLLEQITITLIGIQFDRSPDNDLKEAME